MSFTKAHKYENLLEYDKAIETLNEFKKTAPSLTYLINLEIKRLFKKKYHIQKKEKDKSTVEIDAFSYSKQSFLKFSTYPKREVKSFPLVSIVMTTYNAQKTVENAITSILNQSYPNIELVVCDDSSTDRTWDILKELKNKHKKTLNIMRLCRNSGTYIAKNNCITKASGEIILFQDSDDISHPERVYIQATHLINNPKLIANRSKYLRFNPNTKEIIVISGNTSKYGFITLAVRKEAFEHLGYFDPVRKAGDEEWFQRLKTFYGDEKVKNIDITLYLAELRDDSLIHDAIVMDNKNKADQIISPERKEYVEKFTARLKDIRSSTWFSNNCVPFPLRYQGKYASKLSSIQNIGEKVIAALCSIPSRENCLKQTVNSLINQVDEIHIYLDKYKSTPSFLENNIKISTYHSHEFSKDHRDNAKFIHYQKLKEKYSSFYYFTCDDDIIYPLDYVHTLIGNLKEYDNQVIVGVHGVLCAENPTRYFSQRYVYHFIKDSLSTPKLVNNLGTGTVAFHSSVIFNLNITDWKRGGMVDIYFSKECYKQEVPLIAIPRHSYWLKEAEGSDITPNLYTEFTKKEKFIVDELNCMSPLGYKSVEKTIYKKQGNLQKKLSNLLPPFSSDLLVEATFPRYR